MKTCYLFLVLFNLFSFISFAQSFQIGHRQQSFNDASRSRTITAEIYYPANSAGNDVPIAFGEFPVLVFGHGFVMTWSAYSVEWNTIVPNGYIMVFPTTETSFSPSHTDFAKDIAFLIGQMKIEGLNAASPFYGSIAPTSAVMGHSMGGGSAFLSVQYDNTITALATMAPANTNPSSILAAKNISIPSIVFAGANDCVTPPSQHQIPMYDSLASSCKTLVSIIGGSHCQFADYNFNCYFGEGTCSPQPQITPIVQQTNMFNLLLPWLAYYLKEDCSAGTQFQNIISTGSGITSQQNCSLLCSSLEDRSEINTFKIYPNPFSSFATISRDRSMQNATITLFDMFGRQVKQLKNISGFDYQFEKEELPSGIYTLHITEENNILLLEKLVITEE